jgi:hypothetical protein
MSDIVGESWRPIPGFDGYEASDHGRIRSLDRWVPQKGKKDRWWGGRILSPQKCTPGYLKVFVGKGRQRMIHQLVALAFLGPCPLGMEVAHGDRNKRNNRLSNLRYDTRAGNLADRRIHGTHLEGETCGPSKLTAAEVTEIYSFKGLISAVPVASAYNCTPSNILAIWKGKSWCSVTGAPRWR